MVSSLICFFFILYNYLMDKMQWLLRMSSIYEDIRNKHLDTYLANLSENLSFYYKFCSILSLILTDLIQFIMIYFKWDEIVDYPIAFIIYSLTIQFGTRIGYRLVIRQMIIIIFFCRMHCFLFKYCNNYFFQLSKNHRKRHLKTYLLIHYKICESVEELQTFLRPMFVLITMTFCPIFCSILYFRFKNTDNDNNLMMILVVFTGLIFLILILILSALIALIDVEAKKGSHKVFGYALKLSTKQDTFQVKIPKPKLFLN